jgi:hypothetical protein
VALGYPAEQEEPVPEKERLSLQDIVYENGWKKEFKA